MINSSLPIIFYFPFSISLHSDKNNIQIRNDRQIIYILYQQLYLQCNIKIMDHQNHTQLFFFEDNIINYNYPSPSFVGYQGKQASQQLSDYMNPPKTKKICNKNLKAKNPKKQKKIQFLQNKIKELEMEIQILKSKNFCDMCGTKSGIKYPINIIPIPDTNSVNLNSFPLKTQSQPIKIDNLCAEKFQFQRFEIGSRVQSCFNTPNEQSINLDGQVWIVTGMIMMLMGININGFDGSVDVYKITKQTVDHIRKQVQKSKQVINFPVYYSKAFSEQGVTKEIFNDGFELQGLRIQSIDEVELMFEEQLNFNLKYEALIVMMEYMKEYASFA